MVQRARRQLFIMISFRGIRHTNAKVYISRWSFKSAPLLIPLGRGVKIHSKCFIPRLRGFPDYKNLRRQFLIQNLIHPIRQSLRHITLHFVDVDADAIERLAREHAVLDVLRRVAELMSEEKLVPVPIAIVNKPGGGGAAGIGYVAASRKGDPHTLILINGSTQITPILNPQAKTLTEVKPVMNMMLDDFVLFVRADAPWKTASDFVKDAKSKPAKSVAFSTGGTTDVMAVTVLSKATGVQYNTVSFNSGGEALTALLGGHVQASMGNPLEFMGQLQGGKVRALGVVRDKRFPALKDVPTFQEQGIKTPNFQMWRGIAIPKDAPDAARAYWEGVMTKVNNSDRKSV